MMPQYGAMGPVPQPQPASVSQTVNGPAQAMMPAPNGRGELLMCSVTLKWLICYVFFMQVAKLVCLSMYLSSFKSGVCNHVALLGQIHITGLVHGPQLHVSSSAGETTRWPPTQDWQYPL